MSTARTPDIPLGVRAVIGEDVLRGDEWTNFYKSAQFGWWAALSAGNVRREKWKNTYCENGVILHPKKHDKDLKSFVPDHFPPFVASKEDDSWDIHTVAEYVRPYVLAVYCAMRTSTQLGPIVIHDNNDNSKWTRENVLTNLMPTIVAYAMYDHFKDTWLKDVAVNEAKLVTGDQEEAHKVIDTLYKMDKETVLGKLKKATSTVTALETKVREVEAEKKRTEEQLGTLTSERDDLKKQLENAPDGAAATALNAKLKEAEERCASLERQHEAEMKAHEENLAALQAEATAAHAALQALRVSSEEAHAAYQARITELEAALAKTSPSSDARHQTELEVLREHVQALGQERDILAKKLAESVELEKESRAKNSPLTKQIADLNARIVQLEGQLKAAVEKAARANQAEADALKKQSNGADRDALHDRIAGLVNDKTELRTRVKEKEDVIKRLTEELDAAKQELAQLKAKDTIPLLDRKELRPAIIGQLSNRGFDAEVDIAFPNGTSVVQALVAYLRAHVAQREELFKLKAEHREALAEASTNADTTIKALQEALRAEKEARALAEDQAARALEAERAAAARALEQERVEAARELARERARAARAEAARAEAARALEQARVAAARATTSWTFPAPPPSPVSVARSDSSGSWDFPARSASVASDDDAASGKGVESDEDEPYPPPRPPTPRTVAEMQRRQQRVRELRGRLQCGHLGNRISFVGLR